MICGNCRHDNEAGSRFCAECGAPTAATCPSCDRPQPAGAKFCNLCGTALLPTATGPRTEPRSGASQAVRKNVTALFADLAGSTAFGEQVDPEAARAALAPYFQMLRSTIEDHAGQVAKFTGDGVMALFGTPEVAEDDALRAVNAGIELQQRFGSFADSVRARHGVDLGLRVGINTGELVISDDDADLVGDVLNTAARLEAECEPGRVLVGEETWRLTRSTVTYEVLGEVRVKGKSEPVATFQVVAGQTAGDEDLTPFVGRQEELRRLREAYAEACDSPVARLVTVVGAPGVGKTRLASELATATEARSFALRFDRRGSTTFTPIAELLRSVTDGTADGIERLLADHGEARRLAPILASFLGHGEPRSTEESFWAVRRLLEHLTGLHGPIIVVVDDIQWAEPLFWDLLDHLVEWAEAPALIVALARPELRDLRPELTQAGRRVAVSISLEGLDTAAVRELATRLLDTDVLPAELLERIPATTEGNPLFIRELIQMLVDDGTLERHGDQWRLTIDADAIEVPPTILSLLASRVERLPPSEREVVELASVIGAEFDRGTLEAVAHGSTTAGLGALLDRLRRKDLIEPSGAWAGDHPVYRFHHVLVRDAAYRRLLKERRAELHESVGRHVLESGHGNEADVTVAHHFEQAVRYATELGATGDTTRRLTTIAVERLRRAADLALDREDLAAAGGYARRALDLVADDDRTRDDLLLIGCEALLSSGDIGAAIPLVTELHDRSADDRLAAWADCFQAQLWSFTDPGRLTEAADIADAAARRLDQFDDQAGVAKARLVRAECLTRLGRVGDGEAELDQALGAARAAGDRRRTVAVLGAAPLAALWGPSPVARAGGRCLDVLRLLRITKASPAVEATSMRCQGMLEALRGHFDSAREKLDVARSTATELGLRHGLYETELFAGFVELWADDPSAAVPHLRTAHHGLTSLGLGADAGQAGGLLAHALLRLGAAGEAEALAVESLATAGQNLKTAMFSRSMLAEIRALQGRSEEASALVDEAIGIAERTDLVLDHALVLMAARRVAADSGDADGAAAHASRALQLLDRKGVIIDQERMNTPAPRVGATNGDDADQELPALSNASTRWFAAAIETIWSGDRGAVRRSFTPDFAPKFFDRLDLRPTTADEYVDFAVDSARQRGVLRWTVIAVRGDDLCLVEYEHTHDDQPWTRYCLVGIRDGLCDVSVWFGPDQLGEAVDELDAEWIARDGPWAADVIRRALRAVEAGDVETIRSLLDTDFTAIDHRHIGFGERNADEFSESTISTDGATVFVSEYLRASDAGMVGRVVRVAGDSMTSFIAVCHLDGRRIASLETFENGDAGLACSRLDQLPRRGSAARLTNDATNTFARIEGAIYAGDRETLDQLFADDLTLSYSERLDLRPMNRDDYLDFAADSGREHAEHLSHVIAIRGDELCLVRYERSRDGHMTVRYVLTGVRHGRRDLTAWFDADQRNDAFDALDEEWVRRGGSPFADRVRPILRVLNEGDPDGVRATLTADFVAIDHRPLGFGERDGDEWAAMAPVLAGQRAGVHVADWVTCADHVGVAYVERHVGDNISTLLSVFELRGDRVCRAESFPADDLDAALARFDELNRSERSPDELDTRPTTHPGSNV